ncbi:MAG: heparinase II/III family protein [bacterium]|nr:heparinase II/III family protein [bacterium]
MQLEETGRNTHPCVYLTPKDVQRAQHNVQTYPWAKTYAEDTLQKANNVLDRSPQWIRHHCPDKGAAFAYGFTGCPVCSNKWGTWGGADCSFDRPGTVRCSNGHMLPDTDHPDPGTGYAAPDGRIHYFVGSYNAWVVETYQTWCTWLSTAYILTNDEKYATLCAVILDTLAEIYPSCDKGSWDYPSDPPSGRLCRPWYQVARVLVPLVNNYDMIYNSPALDEPSTVPGFTRRKNIEQNMLKNGAAYCYEQSLEGGMHNGQADYIRGSLAVGCLLGIEHYVDWAVEGPYGIRAMVNNNADRDGRYIESSLGYALHARDLYLTFSEPLLNYRSKKYPQGLNLYDDPVFRSFYVLPGLSLDCAGHWPRYGDSGPDTHRTDPPQNFFNAGDYRYAERLFSRVTDPQIKNTFAALLHLFANNNLEQLRAESTDRAWLLFHANPPPQNPPPLPESTAHLLSRSLLLGQKGIAVLRTPPGPHAQACLLRYGPVLNHGHLDDLNLNYFALGYELTYDLGYGNGSTHTQVGWCKQTASHQLVLVNEKRQQSDPEQDDTGGSLHLFADMPGLQLTDADANAVYRSSGVQTYRRCLALIGNGPESYLLDIFRVEGGQQHDYLAHTLSNDLTCEGVNLGDPQPGSLAGPNINWGERQQNDGFLSGVPQKPYWNAPPENGLGFLMHPRRGTPDSTWSATWTLPDGENHLRLTALPQDNTEVLTAWAPGVYSVHPKAAHVIARRRSQNGPLNSTFVTVREPYSNEPFLDRIEKLPAPDGTTALALHHISDQTDHVLYTGNPSAHLSSDGLNLHGTFAHLRQSDTHVLHAHLVGKSLTAPSFALELAHNEHTGTITRIDLEQNLVYVDANLPDDGRLSFQIVSFHNPAYTRNTAYTIHRIFKENGQSVIDLGPQRIILGQGTLDTDPISATEMTSLTQHDYARGLTRQGTHFFTGKKIVTANNKHNTRITSTHFAQPFELTVESTAGFKAGDTFYYLDLDPGDTFQISNWASVDCTERPIVTATTDITLTLNEKIQHIPWSPRNGKPPRYK